MQKTLKAEWFTERQIAVDICFIVALQSACAL